MIQPAIKATLIADPAVTALVGTYRNQPAIFTHKGTPDNFEREAMPYVVMSGETDITDGYLDGDGKFLSAETAVLVAQRDRGDDAEIWAAAWAVRQAIEAAPQAPNGFTLAIDGVRVTGPIAADPDDLTLGRDMLVRLWLIKE